MHRGFRVSVSQTAQLQIVSPFFHLREENHRLPSVVHTYSSTCLHFSEKKRFYSFLSKYMQWLVRYV
jgi:hypothetical protein